ncbi:MAG: hypothetical protein ACKO23_07960, partial [Gemmataceae bacterium]
MSATLDPSSLDWKTGIGADEYKLRSRLSGLRKWHRFVICIRLISSLSISFLASLLLVGLFDYLTHFPDIIRASTLFTLLVGLGAILFKQFIKPVSKPSDDLSLALKVEEKFPLLNDSLASTIEFLNRSEMNSDSIEMRQETIRRTLKKVEGLPFSKVIETQKLGMLIGLACFLFAISALVTCYYPLHAKTAFSRLTLPFQPCPWPKKTQIEFEKFPQRIGKNRDLRIKGKISGVIPQEIHAEIYSDGRQVSKKAFAIHPDKHTFIAHLKPDETYRNFCIKFTANDASSPEFFIEVLPLPSLGNYNGQPTPQLQIEPPVYCGNPTISLPPGNGNLDLLLGSRVHFIAVADRPLKRAWLAFQPESKGVDVAACLAFLALPESIGSLSIFSLLPFHCSPIDGELSHDNRQMTFTFQPLFSGLYTLTFEDENQLENSRSYDLRVRPDSPPQVRMDRPSPSKDVLQVLPTATLPVHLTVDDRG